MLLDLPRTSGRFHNHCYFKLDDDVRMGICGGSVVVVRDALTADCCIMLIRFAPSDELLLLDLSVEEKF